ncbi:hypothetical protein GUJ93_ZPchr0002g25628 [Zizania palustris]|uniref:Myb/SANT-like domain-containing protein n=1 Tax=Zizania palustris TaxID=103762 RepID=A0A8J5SNT9_ZIZPA|nr:hypothetical protein GUJ93_ZPchr0002g25628 [Zizania palustris]
MAHRVNDKFVSANFVVSQLKDREQRLKKDYNAVKTILSKSGFGWDNVLKMATTIDSLWSQLPEKLQKWKNKSFPYYDDLHEIYNGKIAEGKHCRRSSEKSCKTENTFVGDDWGQMSSPSPTFPTIPSSFVDLVQGGIDLNTENGFDFEIEDSQYKTMAEDLADREAEHYTHTETKISDSQDRPKRKVGAAVCTNMPVRPEREKKKSKSNDNAMNELIALRKEELETYKELTEKQLELKRKQIEQTNPTSDPYSMAKCMYKLNSMSFSQMELLKAIDFLKGDREAREIFMSCNEESLADAYIKGSISI